MKRTIIKVIILVVIIVLGILYAFTRFHKEEPKITTQTMSKATLPVVTLSSGDITINPIHGYTAKMEAVTLRESITPLPEDRKLTVTINPDQSKVKGVSYEVRSLDGSRLVERTEAEVTKGKDGALQATLNIKNLIEDNKEYLLIITLQTDKFENVYYYTRMIRSSDLHLSEKVDFVKKFHDNTFSKDNHKEIIPYLEPNASEDNSTFQKVSIHSKLDQITWGNLAVTDETKAIPTVLEIDPETAAIRFDYLVSVKQDLGDKEYYQVMEYYRIRYTQERVYLLDFERTMEQYFIPGKSTVSGSKVTLGIQTSSIDFLESEAKDSVCFVDNSELWAYRSSDDSMTKVFSFLEDDYTDFQDMYQQHAIKPIAMNQQGDIDFVVYGYMNRGRHEGLVGVSVYHYNAVVNTIEEKVFIPSSESYQALKETIGKFSYVNAGNILYLMINDTIYSIDLINGTYKELIANIGENSYVVSGNSQLLAWQSANENGGCTKITIMNLETGASKDIAAGVDKRIKAIGFMGTDFIYGEAAIGDITTDVAGTAVFPMGYIHILDQNNDEIKQYHIDGIYITDAKIADNMIHLTRAAKTSSGYETVEQDQIINNQADEKKSTKIQTIVTDLKKTQVQLLLPFEIKNTALKVLRPKEVALKRDVELTINHKTKDGASYYVYAKGELEGVYADVGNAVQSADSQTGVVVDENQNYIWQQGNRKVRTQINTIKETKSTGGNTLATCIDALLGAQNVSISSESLLANGQSAGSIIQNNLNKTALDLTDCSLHAVLYYVSQGAPVIAKIDSSNYVLITGYDEFNITVMNPATGTIYKIGLNDSGQLFQSAGNVFISYMN